MTYQTKTELREKITRLEDDLDSIQKRLNEVEGKHGKFAWNVMDALGIRAHYTDGWGFNVDQLHSDFEAIVKEDSVKRSADRLRAAITKVSKPVREEK